MIFQLRIKELLDVTLAVAASDDEYVYYFRMPATHGKSKRK